MTRLDHIALDRQRRRNRLQTMLVLAGIAGWMAAIGALLAGMDGILWALAGTVILLMFQPSRSLVVLRGLYGAVPLSSHAAPDLAAMVRELARRAELDHVPPLYYIPRRQPIALSTGWGRDGAIALSDGMLRVMPPRELVAVLAHEISHLRHGDLRILRLAEAAGRLTRFMSLLGLVLVALILPGAAVMEAEIPLLALVLLVCAPVVSDLLTLQLSRTREYEADAAAAELTGDPQALASALERLEVLADGGWERLRRPMGPSWLRWIRTHPTTAERAARLKELAKPLPTRWLRIPAEFLALALMDQMMGGRRMRRW